MLYWLAKKGSTNGAKELILKEYFGSARQKKTIKQAAKKSAEDQKRLMKRYQQLVKE